MKKSITKISVFTLPFILTACGGGSGSGHNSSEISNMQPKVQINKTQSDKNTKKPSAPQKENGLSNPQTQSEKKEKNNPAPQKNTENLAPKTPMVQQPSGEKMPLSKPKEMAKKEVQKPTDNMIEQPNDNSSEKTNATPQTFGLDSQKDSHHLSFTVRRRTF